MSYYILQLVITSFLLPYSAVMVNIIAEFETVDVLYDIHLC